MKSQYTRDVSPTMMDALEDKSIFKAFVDYVRDSEELALCFRGNDTEIGKVIIYKNNHMIWELCYKYGKPRVVINPNHARFMKKWLEIVKKLMDECGFRGPHGEEFSQLNDDNGFVKRHESEKKYSYDAIRLEYEPKGTYEDVYDVVDRSYSLLSQMQESYFNPEHTEIFDVYHPVSKKFKKEERPRNYIKQYYFECHSDAETDDNNKAFYSNFQKCVEKHVQQDLFMNNHVLKNGLFIYDLEFEQPGNVPGVEIKSKNKPDMFGIRFDSKGNPFSICMIEVKSTPSALKQNSGLEEHLKGMEEYLGIKKKDGTLMGDRIKEARLILNQYKRLGFYGVKREYSESDFKGLKKEIVFVFTGELALDRIIHRNYTLRGKKMSKVTIKDVLEGYDDYNEIKVGQDWGNFVAVKREY